jgi:hypothetical protein
MLSLFKSKPVVADDISDWIFDTMEWALTICDVPTFKESTVLVLPTNEFFAGRVSSEQTMAKAIFDKVVEYANVGHWPFVLVSPEQFQPALPEAINIQPQLRGFQAGNEKLAEQLPALQLTYHPAQLNAPQVMIANMASMISHHLGRYSGSLAPGGSKVWQQTVEVIAVVLGFGVMLANTAYTFKGGCGSCGNPAANRQAALPEPEILYALAIFCHLKALPSSQASKELKSYLRPDFKRAYRQVAKDVRLAELKALLK